MQNRRYSIIQSGTCTKKSKGEGYQMEIKFVKSEKLAKKFENGLPAFGHTFTDHKFEMDYTEGIGWHDARINPYSDFNLDPASIVLHYGQAVFEGLKAYRTPNGNVNLFRPEKNFERMKSSCERLCMPTVDINFAVKALKELLKVEEGWVPSEPDSCVYIRPYMIATEKVMGVKVSSTYKFLIILSPSGLYYNGPVSIYVEDKYVRAVSGGVGNAKAAGNYAAGMRAQSEAAKKGYTQVLWLDAFEKKYIEEVGVMNVFFKINGEVITPELSGSILSGVTRDSVICLLESKGIKVTQRRISIHEIFSAAENGMLEEMFGTGTAAVISPVRKLGWKDKVVEISNGEIGPLGKEIHKTLTGIQYGKVVDRFGWIQTINCAQSGAISN